MKHRLIPSLAAAVLLIALAAPAPHAQTAGPGYLLNLYHFNIQYVVGDEPAMRRIVTQSFEPLVDFYLDHPDWGADFEMQGEMIEFMGENYPEALAKFRRLVNSGQAELVTFHYADTLLLAFPRHDQEWSLKLNEAILKKYDIRRSDVIFAQEAQFGEGYGPVGLEHGYETAIITPGHYGWFHHDDRFPYFTVNGLEVLCNREAVEPSSGIRVKWEFLGDGELVVTGGMNPYFPGLFRDKPLVKLALEQRLKKAEADGYKVSTISAYVQALRDAGVKPSPLKPVLDSPWRPNDGSGVFQWMGKYVFPWEKDYDLRTKNWQVRSILIEAERAGASPEALTAAWGYLINAEVSDPTGWRPTPVEVDWDYEMMDDLMKALAQDPELDLAALKAKAAQGPKCGAPTQAPFPISLTGKAVDAVYTWSPLVDGPKGYCLDVSWTGQGDAAVSFAWDGVNYEYSPAFMEDTIRAIPVADTLGNSIHLGLTNGLVGLGHGTYLVRDNQQGCLAAGLYPAQKRVTFEVKKGKEENYRLKFYVFIDVNPDQVLDFANQTNRVSP